MLSYASMTLDAPSGDGPLAFTASTEATNRYGFSLRSGGWRLDNYSANPVVLWAHDADRPPIGRASATQTDGRLTAHVTFDLQDDLGAAVDRKYRSGFLSAVSVGWDFVDEAGARLDMWSLSAEKMRDEAFYDLMEISAVPVPGDPGALIQRRMSVGWLSPLLEQARRQTERPEVGVTADEVRAVVRGELERLGIRTEADGGTAVGVDRRAADAVLAAFEGIVHAG